MREPPDFSGVGTMMQQVTQLPSVSCRLRNTVGKKLAYSNEIDFRLL